MPAERNLMMPGNPRYQPKAMADIFGYDNAYRGLARVELANLDALHAIGVMPSEDYAHLTPEVRKAVLDIRATDVDAHERAVTKHDVRAWVQLAQALMHPSLARWVHVPLTSYDALDTGRILHFADAFDLALEPGIKKLIGALADQVERHAETVQIGRTHGQHALPITVGFWLATCLERILDCYGQLEASRYSLVGKISGAVGASNALVGLGIEQKAQAVTAHGVSESYEQQVLGRLGLRAGRISTQILQPEPLERFLHDCMLMSQALSKLADDCRHLMRTEIGEVTEPYVTGQVGSSTMAHKRNPINFETVKGQGEKSLAEYLKVLLTLNSEHQRDLTGSAVARDFPVLPIILQTQLDTLLRADKDGVPFIARVGVDEEALKRNFEQSARLVMAEPLYIALQMAGYESDAHELVNHTLVPRAKESGRQLIEELHEYLGELIRARMKGTGVDVVTSDEDANDVNLEGSYHRIPQEVRELLHYPERYTGDAAEKALWVVQQARQVIA